MARAASASNVSSGSHSTKLGLLLYSIPGLVIIGSLLYDELLIPPSPNRVLGGYGGKWKYLTHLNLWMQAVYWILALTAGITTQGYESNKRKTSTLHRAVDYIHSALAFPVGILVCITFWMIYSVDRELIYPKRLDSIIPQWLNHVMHTVHLPFLLIDKYMTHHRYPKQSIGMSILITFALSYQMWILFLGVYKNIWPYPMLEYMNWTFRIVFMALVWVFLLLLYKTGAVVTARLWRGQTQTAARKLK